MPTADNDAELAELDARRKQLLTALGGAVRARREAINLTQRKVEGLMGYGPNSKFLSGVECGHRNLTLDTLYLLAAALRIDPRKLLGAPGFGVRAPGRAA